MNRRITATIFIALFTFVSASVFAIDYTWDGGGGDNDWTTGLNWNPDVPGGPGVGDSVTDIPDGTSIIVDASQTIDNLTITGGNAVTLSGATFVLSVTGTTDIDGDLDATDVDLNFNILTLTGGTNNLTSTSGDMTLTTATMGGTSTITSSGTGDIDITTANMNGTTPTISTTGSGNITLVTGNLTSASTIDSVANLTVSGTVNGNTNLLLGCDGTLTLAGATFGTILNNLTFQGGTTSLTLPAVDIDGNLTINLPSATLVENSASGIDVDGDVDVTITGLFDLTSGAGAVDFALAFDFSGGPVIVDDGSNIEFGTVSATSLNYTSGGSITNTGAIVISGNTILEVAGGGDITINNGGNNFTGTVTVSATAGNIDDLRIADISDFDMQVLTIADDLYLDITGNLTFSGTFITGTGLMDIDVSGSLDAQGNSLTVPDTTTITAGGAAAVILDGANYLNTLIVDSAGDITLNEADGLTLGNINPGGQDCFLNVDGPVIQSDVITADGLSLEGDGPYTLMGNNVITTLAIDVVNNVSFNDTNGYNLNNVGTVTTAQVTTGYLRLSTAAGTVSQTNILDPNAGLYLSGAGNFNLPLANTIGTLASDATGNILVTDSGALAVSTVSFAGIDSSAGNGDVTLNAVSVIFTEAVDTGNGTLDVTTTAGAITANETVDAGNIDFASVGGSITQNGTGVITSSGTATLDSDGGGDIINLDGVSNDFNLLLLNGTTVSIDESNLLTLGTVTSTYLDLTAGGAVDQNGANTIFVTNIRLQGTGSFDLSNNNRADNIEGDTTGAITFTDTTGNLNVGGISATTGITTINTAVVLETTVGNITVTEAINTDTGAGNIELTSNGTIDLNAALTAGTGDIYLDAGGAVNQGVAFTGNGLYLEGAGPFNLALGNNVSDIAGDIDGALTFNDVAGNLAVDTVNGFAGITTSNDAVTLTITGTINVNDPIDTGAGVGDIDITATQINLNDDLDAGTGDIYLNGPVNQVAGTVSSDGLALEGAGPITLMGNNTITTLAIDVAGNVAFNDANGYNLNDVGLVNTAQVTVGYLRLSTAAGTVNQTNILDPNAGLYLSGAGNFNLPLANTIGTLASDATGDILVTDSGALAVGTVSFAGIDSSAGNGDVTLNAVSVTFTEAVDTGNGTLDVTTTAGAITANETVDAGNIDFTSVGGNITQNGTGVITSSGTATLDSDGGGDIINLDGVSNDFNLLLLNGTTVSIDESNLLTLGTVTATYLDLTAAGAVDQNGANTIIVADIRLQGTGSFDLSNNNRADNIEGDTTGAITFTDSTGNLNVGGISGTVGITTINTAVVLETTVGNITVTEAINTDTGAGNIELTSNGTIDLNAALTAGTLVTAGDILLDAGGAVNQLVELAGAGLLLQGTGAFTLDDAQNNIVTLAADNVTNAIDYRDAGDFAVGSVQGFDGVITIGAGQSITLRALGGGDIDIDQELTSGSGIITVTAGGDITTTAPGVISTMGSGVGADIYLTATADIAFGADTNCGTGITIIDSDGTVDQAAGGVLSGSMLQFFGDGDFDLSTEDNQFADFAVSLGVGGSLVYNDLNNIRIFDLSGSGGSDGISTNAQNAEVISRTGNITVAAPVSTTTAVAGNVTLDAGGAITINDVITTGTGNLTLDGGGIVSQSVSFTDVRGLELLGAGPFQLNNGVQINEVDNLAANVSGQVEYIDATALTITTVGGTVNSTITTNDLFSLETVTGGLTITNSVTSADGAITLNIGSGSGGTLDVDDSLDAGAGTLTITTTGDMSQGAGGAATTTGDAVLSADSGGADITWITEANAFGTLQILADNARINQEGAALLLHDIDATMFHLASDSAVTQNPGDAIDDGAGVNSAAFTGDGPFTLTQNNDVDVLAIDATFTAGTDGQVTYTDTDGFDIGLVDGVPGITGAGAVIALIPGAGNVTQSESITAVGLHLQGTGPFLLNTEVNRVDTLAADIAGYLDYADFDDLTIGALTDVAGTSDSGINTDNNDLDLVAGDLIRIDQPVDTGLGEITSFDAGATIYLSSVTPTITTNHANGISLNDPIELETNSSLVTGVNGGDITLGAAATINEDAVPGEYDLLLNADGDINLGGDIGIAAGTFDIRDLTLTAGGGNVTLLGTTDVYVNRDIIISGGTTYNLADQTVDAGRDITVAGGLDVTDSATVDAGRDLTGGGSATVAGVNGPTFTIVADVTLDITVGDQTGTDAVFNIGGYLNAAFVPGDNLSEADSDSLVVFTNATVNGGSTDGVANNFHNLTINDTGTIAASAAGENWTVYGLLTLTVGTWALGNNTHTIYQSWDSATNPGFTFTTTGNSTVVFTGTSNDTLDTDGVESFDNIQFSKSTTRRMALADTVGNSLEVTGNLTISSGQFSARDSGATGQDIYVSGNWADSTTIAGDGFIHQDGEVIFPLSAASDLNPGTGTSPYFYDLTITDSVVNLITDPLVIAAGGLLDVDAATAAASFNANTDITFNGNLELNATGDVATLTMIDGSGAVFTANADVSLLGANAPVLDLTDCVFSFGAIDTLDNTLGEIRLTGAQGTQNFPDVTPGSEILYGLVTYYSADGGSILHPFGKFWNLTINTPGATIALSTDITIYGWSNPAPGDGSLVTPVVPTALNGLRLVAGTLDSAASDMTLYGSFNTTGGTYTHSDQTVIFRGAYPSYIGGDNLFFGFVCDNADVAGKILYMETGGSMTIDDDPAAIIRIHGTNAFPELPSPALMPPPLNFVGPPRSYVYMVSSDPGNVTPYWTYDKLTQAQVDLQYVYLLHSNAVNFPQVIPPLVYIEDCPSWVTAVFVQLSMVRDMEGGHPNGRIDRILVQCFPSLNMDFTDFEVAVDGYTVTGYSAHANHPWEVEPADPSWFYIELEEQEYLDTDATPSWYIVTNNSLRDTTIGGAVTLYDGSNALAPTPKTIEEPYDDADPIIGYTLAVADKDEIFLHFSEPVIQDDQTTEIVAGNFATTAGGGVSGLLRVAPVPPPGDSGMSELLITTNVDITADEIAPLAPSPDQITVDPADVEDFITPSSTHLYDTLVSPDPPDTADKIFTLTHRISDVALGIMGNGIVEPVFAQGDILPQSGIGPGIVTQFDGTEFLEETEFHIEAHRYSSLTWDPQIVYANDAPSAVKNGNLWLPFFGEDASLADNFSGLVRRPYSGASTHNTPAISADLYDYTFVVPDTMIQTGEDFEFFFYYPVLDLYLGRVLDDTASDWYRGVRPWSILIRNIDTQAGGISILNNIINPNRNEQVSLHYKISTPGMVSIQVFDLSGGLVEVLQRGHQETGDYSVSWNGRNRAGNVVARGIYFVRYVGPGGIDQIRKVLVIK